MPTVPVVIGGKTRRRIDAYALAKLADRYAMLGVTKALHEKVGGMTDDDGSRHSAFTFGFGTGQIWQAVASAGIDQADISPAHWKRILGLLGQPKSASVALAVKLFPDHAKLFVGRRPDRAEAALIGYVAQMLSCR